MADMADRKAVKQVAAEALERMGRVDILINNAGTNKPQADRRDQGRGLGPRCWRSTCTRSWR